MGDWIFRIVDALGAVGVGLLILLENIIPPIPSEDILPLAGESQLDFERRRGEMEAVARDLHADGTEAVVLPVAAH